MPFGSTDLPHDFSVADLGERGVSFGPITDEYFGSTLGAAGDVNNDGLGDFLITARLADPSGMRDAGETYLFFGSKSFSQHVTRSEFTQYGMIIHGSNSGTGAFFCRFSYESTYGWRNPWKFSPFSTMKPVCSVCFGTWKDRSG